jgi:hypothetical protein
MAEPMVGQRKEPPKGLSKGLPKERSPMRVPPQTRVLRQTKVPLQMRVRRQARKGLLMVMTGLQESVQQAETREQGRYSQQGRRQMEAVLELGPELPAMELKAGKRQERVRRLAEVAALHSGLGQVPVLVRRMVLVSLALAQGQGRVLRQVQGLERVEEKQLARMVPPIRLNLGRSYRERRLLLPEYSVRRGRGYRCSR